MMASTTSNQFMIPLTNVQKSILKKLEDIEHKEYRIEELENVMQTIAQPTWIYKTLNKLAEYNLIERNSQKLEGISKPVLFYKYKNIHNINLPSFKDLEKNNENNEYNENNKNSENSKYTEIKPSKDVDTEKKGNSLFSLFSLKILNETHEEYLEDW